MTVKVHIETGDLTAWDVDAIVNAANNALLLGGGLAGAIRRAGGPEIQAECDLIGPIKIGQAAITTAGNLPCRFIIHQASMALGGMTSDESLRESTRAVLALAEKNDIKTLAFPATGTGIAGFGMEPCAKIMLDEVKKHISGETTLTDVYFVLFDERAAEIFKKTWQKMGGKK